VAYNLIGDVDEMMDAMAGYGEEIVGDDEIGDDDDEEMGAEYADDMQAFLGAVPLVGARRKKKKKNGGEARALARAMRAARGQQLARVQNVQARRYPLGLGATSIGAGATAIISANPQLPFRVNRLVTPSTGLLIDNLAVGTVSQFVAAGAVPTEVFAPGAFGVGLKGDTAVPGVSVQITVSNPTAGALTFSGAIIGTVAQ